MEADGTKEGFAKLGPGEHKPPWPEQAGNGGVDQALPVPNPLQNTDSHCLELQENSSGCELGQALPPPCDSTHRTTPAV